MSKDMGGNSGSREPNPQAVSAPTARMVRAFAFVRLAMDEYVAGRCSRLETFDRILEVVYPEDNFGWPPAWPTTLATDAYLTTPAMRRVGSKPKGATQ